MFRLATERSSDQLLVVGQISAGRRGMSGLFCKLGLLVLGMSAGGACATSAGDGIDDPLHNLGKADGGKPVEIYRWSSATNVVPATLPSVAANYSANHCELWVNGFGRGDFANGGYTQKWLE